MLTRRTFLASLASLAAAAGLSRFAPGAAKAAEPAPVAPQPKAPPKLLSWSNPEPLPSGWSGAMRVRTNASEWRNGKWRPSPWRLMRYERGRLVEVSPALPEVL